MFFLMQNIFIVLAMQYGCVAKPLFTTLVQLLFWTKAYAVKRRYTEGQGTGKIFQL